jgi:hypothetical protein
VRGAGSSAQGIEAEPDPAGPGSILITPENLYEPENQKLLFPFVE